MCYAVPPWGGVVRTCYGALSASISKPATWGRAAAGTPPSRSSLVPFCRCLVLAVGPPPLALGGAPPLGWGRQAVPRPCAVLCAAWPPPGAWFFSPPPRGFCGSRRPGSVFPLPVPPGRLGQGANTKTGENKRKQKKNADLAVKNVDNPAKTGYNRGAGGRTVPVSQKCDMFAAGWGNYPPAQRLSITY